ncbi:MAG: T9SS type A sorting domain-containing protein, partial [Bacteroidota bacterium]|nr:T9SS type A sorting domain-containing protein [Bacteroidota bacterium]
NGNTWEQFNSTGLTNRATNQVILTSRDYLFVGTMGGGIFRSVLPITSVIDHEQLPERIILWQNYPNPFNPSTTIRFELPTESFVTLKVYNLLGKEVATLVNEAKKMGRYEFQWDATGYPSGLYFYRLTTNNFIQTKKLLLIK